MYIFFFSQKKMSLNETIKSGIKSDFYESKLNNCRNASLQWGPSKQIKKKTPAAAYNKIKILCVLLQQNLKSLKSHYTNNMSPAYISGQHSPPGKRLSDSHTGS